MYAATTISYDGLDGNLQTCCTKTIMLNTAPPHITPAGVLQSVISITGERDREILERTLVTTLAELIPQSHVSMHLIARSELGEEIVLAASAPLPASSSCEPPTPLLLEDRPDFLHVLQTGQDMLRPATGDTCRVSVYPITSQHSIVGLLEIAAPQHNEQDRRLVQAFLKIYSNYLSLLDESETDTLTGLLNRRTFDNNLEKIIASHSLSDQELGPEDPPHPIRRSGNEDLPHWLAIIDIDHFKKINDQFGHLYGDEVLILLARNMQRIFRQRDKLFRFGGEEFVVVLDRTSNENARQVLERFRTAIEHYEFPQIRKVTISIGFVCLAKPDVPSAIVGRADQALYFAKHHGRNLVCQYEELLAAGKLGAEHFSNDVQLF